MSTKTGRGFFYGWVIVLAGTLITGASIGTFNNTLGVFIKPVTEGLGFDRGYFTLYNTVMGVSGMLMMPVYGEFYRKDHIKVVMFICACVLALAYVGYSFSSELWHFYLFAVFAGSAANGCSTVAISTIVNNWFSKKKGLATGLALSGTGLFASVMVPLVTWVTETYSWRWGYRTMSAVGLAFLLPSLVFLIKVKPSDMGLLPYGFQDEGGGETVATAQAGAVGFTRREALRMPCFYFITIGILLSLVASTCMQSHNMSHLTDIGYSTAFASGIVSITMLSLMAGKILIGWVIDRFGILVGCVSAAASTSVSLVSMLFARFWLAPYIFAISLGYALALGSVAPGLVTIRYFGSKEFSRIFAFTGVAGGLSTAIGQPFGGFVFDAMGSYNPAWIMGLFMAGAACVLFVLADMSNKRAWDKLIAREAEIAKRTGAAQDGQMVAAGENSSVGIGV